MRVLFVIPTLVRGGAEKQLALLAMGLPRERFDVHVCALTSGGPWQAELEAAGVPTTVIGKRWKLDPWAYWRLKKHIRDLRPDLVHTWLFAANSYGRQAAFSAGVKHVIAGERCVDRWKAWHEFAIDRHLARRTARIVTNSTGVVEFYARHRLPIDKFTVIPNGVAPFDAAAAPARASVLAEWKLPADAWLIGAVGRLWPQKRVLDLLYALDLLKCVSERFRLLIIGDGPLRDRVERTRRKMGLTREALLLGDRGDVPRLLPSLDCFWLASEYEGQSNALMEAMMAARPVVATDIAGNRDLVVDERSGFLTPVGAPGEMARRAKALFDDPALAARLGAAARERMLAEFSVPQMVRRHAELYQQIVG